MLFLNWKMNTVIHVFLKSTQQLFLPRLFQLLSHVRVCLPADVGRRRALSVRRVRSRDNERVGSENSRNRGQ